MPKSSFILANAAEVAQLGLAELEPEGRFVAVNPPYLSMLCLNESDLLGKPRRITVHLDDHERAEEAYAVARTTGGSYVEFRGLRRWRRSY